MRRLFGLALILAISHTLFAVNASSAKETDADVPLTGISASLQPDLFTGILTGSIPIEVPPGRNGLQPNLALSYASSGGNGWVGMGWKLEMGTIERQTRWGVLYNPTTAEEQAGKVYTIRVNGISADLVPAPAPAPSDEYRAKIEGEFLRIKKLAGGWEVTDKKGTKYFFGRTTPFQIQDSAVGIFKWCLERVEDRDGNYMTITYSADQGQGYLSQIDYAGNGATAPTNQVKFYLENRPDASEMYTSNFKIKTAKRLITIEVKAGGNLVRAYQLNYLLNGTTRSSVFSTFQQFGKDASVNQSSGTITPGIGPQLSPIVMGTQVANNALTAQNAWGTYVGINSNATIWRTDMNGDGKQDLLYLNTPGTEWHVMLNTGTGLNAAVKWGDYVGINSNATIWPTDMNGDRKQDLLFLNTSGTQWMVMKSLCTDDLLSSISTGLGGATTITYTPSPQHSTTSTPAHPQLPYPVYTVTSMTTTDGNSNSSTTTYAYTGGYHQIGERDFRGFKTAAVTSPGASDADKTVTTTWFHQGNEVTPIDTENPGLANGYMKGTPYRVEVRRKSDNLLYSKLETTYLPDQIGLNTSAPWFTPQAQVDSLVCDGGPCTTTRVTFAAADYDAYGNVKKESHHGNIAVAGDEKTIERAFIVNTTNYLVGFPIRETVYKGLSVASVDKLAETIFYYDGTGTGACTAAPTGSNTTVTKGHLTKTERWLNGGTNPISGMEYDPTTGVLLCTRDPLGNKTTLAHDPTKTFVLTTTNQLGHINTVVISGVNGVAIDPATGFYGQVKSATDPNGKIVTHEYDKLGRKTKTTAPDGLVTTVTYPALAEYGVIGTQKITTSTSGASVPAALTSSTFFDGLGRTITKESSGPNSTTRVTKTEYNVKGQTFRTSLPYFKTSENVTGRWRTMSYDAPGRVTQITHPDTLSGSALTTKSCYAPFVTVTLDASGARKRETKDAYGRAVKIEEYSTTTTTCDTTVGSPYATTNYTYDLLGNLTKVVDHLGNRTTMRYDTLSRKIGMSDPDMSTNGTTTCADLTALNPNATYPWYAAPCWNYQYDGAGNLTRQTDAKNQHLWFRYDGLNRRSQKDYTTQKAQGSGDVVYVYDDTVTTFNRKGRLKQVTDASGNVTFEYDSRGRISKSTKVLDAVTYVTTSIYDGLGRLKEVTYPSTPAKTVEYLYTGPVLDKVQDKAGSGTTIYATYMNYTSQGQPQTTTYGNGVVTTNTYADPAHATCVPANSFRLCTLKTQKGTNPVLQDLTYTFTADGDVDLITDPLNGNQDFGYDVLDRLTSATGPYGTGGATATLTYAYNQIGNLTNNSQLGAYTYPTSGAGVVRPHTVTAAGGNSYSYDNNGNLTSGAGRTLTWNLENKPLTVVQGGTTTTFVYDGDGGRVKKIVGTTTTRYISTLYECDNTNCSRFIWAGSTRVATIAASGTIHYWHGDHLGSSSVITDSTGAKVQALTYYPYGATRTNVPGTPVNVPYKFTGKELDNTGLYYYEARYYDPTLGRFISADTMIGHMFDPQDLNRYAYARNNPILYTDPTGHFFKNFFKSVFKDFFRPLNSIGTTAKEVWHQPLRGISPLYMAGAYYRYGVVSNPGLRAAGLDEELDRSYRDYQRFRDSRVGRYIDGAIIVTAVAVGTWYCGGCGAVGVAPTLFQASVQGAYIGATIGSVSGFAQAAATGGDPFMGAVIGGAIGAAGGAVGGGVGHALKPLTASFNTTVLSGVPFDLEVATVSQIGGSVVGGSFSGGLNAAASGSNIGNGIGFGALSGAIGGAYGGVFGESGLGKLGENVGKLGGDSRWSSFADSIHGGALDVAGDHTADQFK